MTMLEGVLRQPSEIKTVSMGPNVVAFVLGGEDTGGAYSLTRFTMAAPPHPGPPLHIHGAEIEVVYVLDGQVELTLGDRSIQASTGAALLVPKGTRHGVSNLGPGTATILVIISPPGFEQYWSEMAGLLASSTGQPDPAAVLSLQKRHHMDTGGQVRRV